MARASAVAREKLAPIAAEVDQQDQYDPRNLNAVIEAGLIAPTIPREYGGAGLSELELHKIMEEISWASTSAASMITNQLAAANTLLVAVTKNQGRNDDGMSAAEMSRYLQMLATGELIGTLAITESEAGSDVAAIRTTALRTADSYILNGAKHLISFLGVADFYIIFAKTAPGLGHRGITAFLVEAGNPGLKIGPTVRKMGQRGMPTGSLSLVDCRVPLTSRVGPEGDGFYIAMQVLNRMRIAVSAQAVGVARAAFEAALQYARGRQAFGKPLVQHQAIAHKLADMAIGLETARLLGQKAAQHFDRGEDYVLFASMAKVYATEVARDVVNDALQIHGGNGYTADFPVERYYRDQRVMELYAGTSEIQRLIIGRILAETGS